MTRSLRNAPPSRLPLAAAVLLASVAGACATDAPPFPTVPGWDEPDRVVGGPADDERKLWKDAERGFEKLVEDEQEYGEPDLETYLDGIVARIAPPLAKQGPRLDVRVIRDVEHNASALPDGTLLISLPLVAALGNEAQVAFVLAHEIVHVTKRHSLLSSRYDAATASLVDRMDLSRRLEAEADREAIAWMVRAGYSPREAAPALTHIVMSDPEQGRGVASWQSHADLRTRLGVIRRAVAKTGAPRGEDHTERYQHALDPHRLAAAEIELDADRYDDALTLVDLQIERLPESAPAYLLRARIAGDRDPKLRRSESFGADLERAVELAPEDPDALRALGLFLRDTGERERSRAILRRYLEARPDAYDRKLIERYLVPAAS